MKEVTKHKDPRQEEILNVIIDIHLVHEIDETVMKENQAKSKDKEAKLLVQFQGKT